MTEQNVARAQLFQEMLNIPHGNLGPTVQRLRAAMRADPSFTSQACVYLNMPESGNTIRDLGEAAIITLLQSYSIMPEYRDAGRATLLGSDVYPATTMPGLEPFRIFRVDDYMARRAVVSYKGRVQPPGEVARFRSVKVARKEIAKLVRQFQYRLRRGRQAAEVDPADFTVAVDPDHVSAPRAMRAIMHDYFAMLETQPLRADGVILRNRKAMRRSWRRHYLKSHYPGQFPRIEALLSNRPPEDSRLHALKAIAQCEDPVKQTKMIIDARIPLSVATSILGKPTMITAVGLLEVMSGKEALNARGWFERHGFLRQVEFRALYRAKVGTAKGSAASFKHRQSTKGKDTEVDSWVAEAAERAASAAPRITQKTLLLIDRSLSMELAIAVARELVARTWHLCDAEVMVVSFNDMAMPITRGKATTLDELERKLSTVRALGSTSIGVGLRCAIRDGFVPEQVVIVTDKGENTRPYLVSVAESVPEWQSGLLSPRFVFVTVPGDTPRPVVEGLRGAGFRVDEFSVKSLDDWYFFDQISAILSGAPERSIVERIMDLELPTWRRSEG